ncbi:MAG TPA: hypothetical protein PLB12_09040 [Candidatus Goldiibacteriota bacterium]|nr:hypothetical protein [Candidatus Goldiibacteriota bacterium]HPI02661.1 hypothetical protein [Candidatus Goldiibacteriota bacterium]HPN65566.1 hypothetical protein [Candidatus Goldiibacteriota bacterium]HRQ44483.1 hypothetical protein [Candidatus Goldiibacteriota bacterium]
MTLKQAKKNRLKKKNVFPYIAALFLTAAMITLILFYINRQNRVTRADLYTYPIEKTEIIPAGDKIESGKKTFEYYEYGKKRTDRGVYVLKVINNDGSQDYRYSLKTEKEIMDYDFGPGVNAYVTLEDDSAQKDTVIFRVWMDSENDRKKVEDGLSGLFRVIKKHRPEKNVRGEIKVRE